MRILNWNVRGLEDADKCSLVKDALLSCHSSIVCLQETKLQMLDAMKASSFLPPQLRSFLYMPSTGSSGGLLVAWDANAVDITDLYKDQFCISARVQSVSNNTSFQLTTVYAPCEDSDRPDFFRTLDRTATLVEGPWVLLGDFNMYRYAHEKSRGRRNWAVMESFNSWIRDNAMDDIDISNRQFTWSNKRREPTMVKLDRVLVNAEWNLGFLNTSASVFTATTSDHSPIVVDFYKGAPNPTSLDSRITGCKYKKHEKLSVVGCPGVPDTLHPQQPCSASS